MPTLTWISKQAVEKHHLEIPFRFLEYDESLSVGEKESGGIGSCSDINSIFESKLEYMINELVGNFNINSNA